MPVLPMDLQVNMMQAHAVADEESAARTKRRTVDDEEARRRIRERQLEENSSDEAGETNQEDVDENANQELASGEVAGGAGPTREENESEEVEATGRGSNKLEKGTHFDERS